MRANDGTCRSAPPRVREGQGGGGASNRRDNTAADGGGIEFQRNAHARHAARQTRVRAGYRNF
jgi:hypothetical protein